MKIALLFIACILYSYSLFSQTFQKSQQDIELFNYKLNNDGNIIALGKTPIYNATGNEDYCIAKFDNIGNLLSVKVINETRAVATHREKIETFEDSTILVSISMYVDSIYPNGDTINIYSGVFIKFDHDLNVLYSKRWDKTYICDMLNKDQNLMTSYVLGC